MANIIQGGDLMLFLLKGTGSSAKTVSIAFATSHSLTINAETTDTTHKDIKGGWTSSEVKSFSWEVSTENLYADDGSGFTFADLFDLMTNKSKINAVFAVTKTAAVDGKAPATGWEAPGDDTLKGEVIITSLELNAPSGDNATFTCSFNGVGPLTRVPKA